MNIARSLDQRWTRWLTGAENHAAQRLGLYRILYALFYLNIAHGWYPTQLAQLPAYLWQPVLATSWLTTPPSEIALRSAEFVLVGALVLLAVGLRVRLMTLVVLVSGVFLAGVRYSFGKIDHFDTYMIAYIPLVMLFADWGATYSLDARRKSKPWPENGWAIRVILWLLGVMFMLSGIQKFLGGWGRQFDAVQILLFRNNLVENPNPLNFMLASTPLLYVPLQLGALVFETGFPIALLNSMWRTFVIASAVLFHLFILLFMHINFAHMLIVYALFVDWQAVYEKLNLERIGSWLAKIPTKRLVVIAWAMAGVVVLLWQTPATRALLPASVWSLHYLWWVAVPAAVIALIRALVRNLGTRRIIGEVKHVR